MPAQREQVSSPEQRRAQLEAERQDLIEQIAERRPGSEAAFSQEPVTHMDTFQISQRENLEKRLAAVEKELQDMGRPEEQRPAA